MTRCLRNTEVQESKDLLRDTEKYVRKCDEIQSKEFTRENIDEVVEIDPGHKTLLELIIADEAIKDTVYALGHLLNEGNLSLEIYLKKRYHPNIKSFDLKNWSNFVHFKRYVYLTLKYVYSCIAVTDMFLCIDRDVGSIPN